MNQQYALEAQKASCFLDFIKSSVASRLQELILPFFSALVRVDLGYWIQLWCSQHKKDMDLSECIEEGYKYNQRARTSLL